MHKLRKIRSSQDFYDYVSDKKYLSDFGRRLRGLTLTHRKQFLEKLEAAVERKAKHPEIGSEASLVLHSLAYSAYDLLEGVPYTQPEFASQMTPTDVRNSTKFQAIGLGILNYSKASEKERAAFRKKVLRTNVFENIIERLKKTQNTRA